MARYDELQKGYRIFIGDLGHRVSRYDLEREFDSHGPIKDVWIARDPPGFAFIVYKHSDDAEEAVRKRHGRFVCGRRVRVEHARPYEERIQEVSSARNKHRLKPRSRSRSRKRSGRSRTRSRSRSQSKRKRKKHSRSRSRSRKRNRSSRSRTKSRSRSRTRREKKRSHSHSRSRNSREKSNSKKQTESQSKEKSSPSKDQSKSTALQETAVETTENHTSESPTGNDLECNRKTESDDKEEVKQAAATSNDQEEAKTSPSDSQNVEKETGQDSLETVSVSHGIQDRMATTVSLDQEAGALDTFNQDKVKVMASSNQDGMETTSCNQAEVQVMVSCDQNEVETMGHLIPSEGTTSSDKDALKEDSDQTVHGIETVPDTTDASPRGDNEAQNSPSNIPV